MKKVVLLSLLALGSSELCSSYGMHGPNEVGQSDSSGTRVGVLRRPDFDSRLSDSPVMEDIIQRLTRAEAQVRQLTEENVALRNQLQDNSLLLGQASEEQERHNREMEELKAKEIAEQHAQVAAATALSRQQAQLAQQREREEAERRKRIDRDMKICLKPLPRTSYGLTGEQYSRAFREWDKAAARLLAEGIQPPAKRFYPY